MKKFTEIIKITLASLIIMLTSSPLLVSASPVSDACSAISGIGGQSCDKATADKGFSGIIGTIINILTIIVGAVSVIMIIIGGFRYVISSGDSNAMSGAKNTILYAIVGLVVALSAQLIVAFVINKS